MKKWLSEWRKWAPWAVATLLLGLWFARPLWSAKVLPLDDIPNHLARITALHHLNDPRWNLSPYYQRSLGLVPYLGHFYVVHLLAYVFGGVVRANLVYMILYVLSAPLCGLAFARATGRSPWLALLLLPLSIGYFFQWGFVSFCVAVMLTLVALAQLWKLLDSPSVKGAVAVFALTVILYLCHVLPWGAFGVAAGACLITEAAARRFRGPLYAAGAMLPSVGLFWMGLRHAKDTGYISSLPYFAEEDPPSRLLRRVASTIDLFQKQTVEEWVQIGLVLLVVALLVSDAGRETDEPLRKRLRIPLVLLVFVAGALFTPFSIKRPFNWWMINLRFLMLICAVGVFLPRGPIRGARAVLFTIGIMISLLLPFHMTRNFKDFSKRAEPVIRLIMQTPLGSNTLFLHTPGESTRRNFTDPVMAPEMAIWRELYNYPQVYRGGFNPYLYDDGFPVKRIKSLPAPRVESAATQLWNVEDQKFDPETMMADWDYFIVKSDNNGAMPPDGAALVASDDWWSLYRNLRKQR
jgi:hypothetical protein